ncbi:MAG: methyltransferase domain-containing protein [Armatimonadota bacterium]
MSRSAYDPTLYEGAARDYARYRLPYPRSLFEHLVSCFRLDGTGRALDLGCGTGQLAIPLAPYFEQVVAMDPDRGMLDEARRAAEAAGVANVRFVQGSSWELAPAMGQFRLVTMAIRSIGWIGTAPDAPGRSGLLYAPG